MRLAVTMALGAALLAAAPVLADNDSGLYFGAGVGQYNIELADVDGVSGAISNFSSEDTAFKLFGGWRFNRYFALELAYLDLGNAADVIAVAPLPSLPLFPVPATVAIDGFAPYVVGTLPLGSFELFAKVGYFFLDSEVTLGGGNSVFPRLSESDSDEEIVYAFGAGVTVFERLNLRLEYEIVDIADTDESDALWLTGAWRF